jgi:hypothetical protein
MTSVALMKVAATFFLGGFFSLVTIINPPSALPLFTALSAPLNNAEQRRLAVTACTYSFFILIVSLFAGSLILNLFGVSYPALRVAGGICVLLLGHGMLFGHGGVNSAAQGAHATAFFPLALPASPARNDRGGDRHLDRIRELKGAGRSRGLPGPVAAMRHLRADLAGAAKRGSFRCAWAPAVSRCSRA